MIGRKAIGTKAQAKCGIGSGLPAGRNVVRLSMDPHTVARRLCRQGSSEGRLCRREAREPGVRNLYRDSVSPYLLKTLVTQSIGFRGESNKALATVRISNIGFCSLGRPKVKSRTEEL